MSVIAEGSLHAAACPAPSHMEECPAFQRLLRPTSGAVWNANPETAAALRSRLHLTWGSAARKLQDTVTWSDRPQCLDD